METKEKCGLCVDARTVRERYELSPCSLLILTLPAGFFAGRILVGPLLHKTVPLSARIMDLVAGGNLVASGSFCILFLVISYFLLCRLGRSIVGTYLYHFKDADEVTHCHKHDYGSDAQDVWRRTQGAQDNTYLREAVGGWLKTSSVFRNGREVKSISVKALGASGMFRVTRENTKLTYLEPDQILLAEDLIPGNSFMLLFQLLERQRCVDEAVGARRQIELLNEALDAQALRLASTIDFALGQKRGGRESQAVAGIREKLESMLEELLIDRLGTLRERIATAPEGEWAAGKEHLLRLIDARLNRRETTVDEPLLSPFANGGIPPLPDEVDEHQAL